AFHQPMNPVTEATVRRWPWNRRVRTLADSMNSSFQRRRGAMLFITIATVAMDAVASPSRGVAQGAAQGAPPQTAKRSRDSIYVAKARADSARLPYTEADVYFMQGMISHHAQAIVMAKWAPTHGASAPVRTLCERIINAQTDEIALMQQWLRDRHQRVPDAVPAPMKMMMDGMEHEMLMPGMLSADQMK